MPRRRRVSLPEPVPLEHLVDLLDVQPFALRQQQVNEDGAQGAASSKKEENTAGSMICSQSGLVSPLRTHVKDRCKQDSFASFKGMAMNRQDTLHCHGLRLWSIISV